MRPFFLPNSQWNSDDISKSVDWLFDLSVEGDVGPCPVFRTAVFLRSIIAADDVAWIDQWNRDFLGPANVAAEYPHSPFKPHVLQIFWMAVRMETLHCDALELCDLFLIPHYKHLSKRYSKNGICSHVQRLELYVGAMMDWKLLPNSPFVCLWDLDGLQAPEELVRHASFLLRKVVVDGNWAEADVLAAAALVAAECLEVGAFGDSAFLATRVLVACASAPEHFRIDFDSVAMLGEYIVYCGRPTTAAAANVQTPKKRRIAEVESPNSVLALA